MAPLLRKTDSLRLLVLLLLSTTVTCRPIRLPRQAKDDGKSVKDDGVPKDDLKKDHDETIIVEGDIIMSWGEYLQTKETSFDSADPEFEMSQEREKRQADVPVDGGMIATAAVPITTPTVVPPTTVTVQTAATVAEAKEITTMATVPTAEVTTMSSSVHLPPSTTNNRLWPNCRVPYIYETFIDAHSRTKFMMAMKMWEDATCIDFVHATTGDEDYLLLKRDSICKSNVGRRGGGAQVVSIADGCSEVGNAAHELGHAIGLWHEHSRPDRDQYIEVHRDNVLRSDYENFDLVKEEVFNQVPDVGYDIQSVMHYGSRTFSWNGEKTITIREGANLPELNCTNTLRMGQRERLSYKDKKRVSLLYNCPFSLPEPECIKPSPTTPTPTTATPTTMMPTPTTTTKAPATPPPLDVKLHHGNVIALTFGNKKDNTRYGVQCVPSPGCVPVECVDFGGNTCKDNENQFQILNHNSSLRSSNDKIKSGYMVLLRSVRTPSYWLDCSEPTQCVISQCNEDNVEDPGNSSYISNCSKHHFEVLGRPVGKLLSTNHRLQFRNNSGFLNCNGKRCSLLPENSCPNLSLTVVAVTETDGQCPVERYEVIKLSEF